MKARKTLKQATWFQIVLVSWARERADLTHLPNPLPSPSTETEKEGGAAARRRE